MAEDAALGLVLLEDLGDDTYTRLLARGADEAALYKLATDMLIDLHTRPASEAAMCADDFARTIQFFLYIFNHPVFRMRW